MQRDEPHPATPLNLLLGEQARDSTGVVFVTTSDNRQVRIALDGGRIVHIGVGNRRGAAAVQAAVLATGVSATFMPGQLDFVDDDLLPERALIAALAPMLSGNGHAAAPRGALDGQLGSPTHVPTGTTVAPHTVPPAASRKIDRAKIALIRSAMVEFVGPIAEVLVNEHIAAGVQDVEELIRLLAEQIGNVRDAQAFLAAIGRQRL